MYRGLLAVVVAAVLAAGCGSDSPTSPSPAAGAALTASVRAALGEAIADEYRAEAIYQGVVDDFGSTAPFVNVLTAEKRHSTSLAGLFEIRGLPVPANAWSPDAVPHFQTLTAACAAGVVAERDNIAMYDRLFAIDLPTDARRVLENNRAASLFNHLPAFERCAA